MHSLIAAFHKMIKNASRTSQAKVRIATMKTDSAIYLIALEKLLTYILKVEDMPPEIKTQAVHLFKHIPTSQEVTTIRNVTQEKAVAELQWKSKAAADAKIAAWNKWRPGEHSMLHVLRLRQGPPAD